jgi:hypothetical protein
MKRLRIRIRSVLSRIAMRVATPSQAPHHVTHGQRGVLISVTTYHTSSIMKILSGSCQNLFKTAASRTLPVKSTEAPQVCPEGVPNRALPTKTPHFCGASTMQHWLDGVGAQGSCARSFCKGDPGLGSTFSSQRRSVYNGPRACQSAPAADQSKRWLLSVHSNAGLLEERKVSCD